MQIKITSLRRPRRLVFVLLCFFSPSSVRKVICVQFKKSNLLVAKVAFNPQKLENRVLDHS